MVMHVCPHCGDRRNLMRCPKCDAELDSKGVCPALCKPPTTPAPKYEGPVIIGSTHIGRMARGHG